MANRLQSLLASVYLASGPLKTFLEEVAAAVGLSLSNANPSNVGTSPSPGVSSEASKGDHVHAHGDLPWGSLHALAIAGGAAGFMSGTDKTKLDSLPSGPVVQSFNTRTGAVVLLPSDFDDTIHGNRGGGSLHALAIAGGAAGFMSGADKTKIDSLPSVVARGAVWNLNGDLALADVDATPPAGDGGSAFFDGTRIFLVSERITLFSMVQRCTGSAGNTTVEVWRYRAGVFFQLATMTVASGAAFASTTALPPAGPDDVLVFGDLVLVRLADVQQDDGISTPCDLTVTLHTEVQP